MPLPPAPSKRAALLTPEAYDAPARTSHKAARKTEAHVPERAAAEKPQVGLDFEPRSGGTALHEEAPGDQTDLLDQEIEVLEDNRDWIETRMGKVFAHTAAAQVKAFTDAGKELPEQMKQAMDAARKAREGRAEAAT